MVCEYGTELLPLTFQMSYQVKMLHNPLLNEVQLMDSSY